jgi:hypothetical protein
MSGLKYNMSPDQQLIQYIAQQPNTPNLMSFIDGLKKVRKQNSKGVPAKLQNQMKN